MDTDNVPKNELEERKGWKKPEVIDIDGEIEAATGAVMDMADGTTS